MPKFICAVAYEGDCCSSTHTLVREVEAATPEDAERLVREANERGNADEELPSHEIMEVAVYSTVPPLGGTLVEYEPGENEGRRAEEKNA